MTTATRALRRLDLSDVLIVAGFVLLWIGLDMVAPALPFIVVGALLLGLALGPILRGRR